MYRSLVDFAKARILVVDDDPLSLFFLKSMLDKAEFGTIEALSDGRAALKRCRKGELDLVILDMEMPDISGLEVLSTLGAEGRLRELSVIIVTGNDDEEMRWSALELGAMDYIHKPFQRREIDVRVGNAVGLRLVYRELAAKSRELERRVAERTQKLEGALGLLKSAEARMADALGQITRHNDQLARRANHVNRELRTPLKAIVGYAQVLTSSAFGPLGNERYLRYAKDIEATAAATVDLISDSLDPEEATKLDVAADPAQAREDAMA